MGSLSLPTVVPAHKDKESRCAAVHHPPSSLRSSKGHANKSSGLIRTNSLEQSVVNGLDNLEDEELDELLSRALEINKRLRGLIRNRELEADVEVKDQKPAMNDKWRNTITLPPLAKKGRGIAKHLTN